MTVANNNVQASVGRGRKIGAVLTLILVPFGGGALIAPYIFNMLLLLGRNVDSLQTLRSLEFASVATRCMLILFLVSVWPALSLAVDPKEHLRRLFSGKGCMRDIGLGLLLGTGSMAIVPLLGVILGAFAPGQEWGGGALNIAGIMGVGLLVAFLEETLFRGVVFDLFESVLGPVSGVILASLIFALVHFLQPITPPGIVHGHWYSGFALLWKAIVGFDPGRTLIFPYVFTLFLIGASLCLVYLRKRNVYLIAGLHAGWIFVLKISGDVFASTGRSSFLFGKDMGLEKSYAAMFLALAFLFAVTWYYERKQG